MVGGPDNALHRSVPASMLRLLKLGLQVPSKV
jgi:hypothetical protein